MTVDMVGLDWVPFPMLDETKNRIDSEFKALTQYQGQSAIFTVFGVLLWK